MECFVDVYQILLVDGAIRYFYTADFPPNVSINCWERYTEVPEYNCGFEYLSFPFYHFFFVHFTAAVWGINIKDCCVFLMDWLFSLFNIPYVFVDFLCSEVYFIS